MYLNRNQSQYDDWYCVVIFPSRSLEPSDQKTHRIFLNSDQVQRIYLNELGTPNQQPIGINLIQLTIASEKAMAEQARLLIERVKLENTGTLAKNDIIDIVTTIAFYKLSNLSREEVETMLGLNIEETRLYQDLERQTKLKIVPKLLNEGLSVEKIADILNLTVGEVTSSASSQQGEQKKL
jgi:predicted transposase/invertase (TIGR01784 family)